MGQLEKTVYQRSTLDVDDRSKISGRKIFYRQKEKSNARHQGSKSVFVTFYLPKNN